MARETSREIYYWQIQAEPLNIYLVSSKKGAMKVALSLRREFDGLNHLRKIFPSAKILRNKGMNRALIRAVEGALTNRPMREDLSLDIACTPFQLEAWKAIAQIPFGQTKTYGEVALMMGRPGTARAVGQAMGRNPLPLFFP